MCESNYEKILIESGIAEIKTSERLKCEIIVPTSKFANKAKHWTEKECDTYAKKCVEVVSSSLSGSEKDEYGTTAQFVDASNVFYFIDDVRKHYASDKQYFKKMEEENFHSSLWGLEGLAIKERRSSIKQKCEESSEFYSKTLLAIKALEACRSMVKYRERYRRLKNLGAPEIILQKATNDALITEKPSEEEVRKVFRTRGMKKFIIENFVNPLEEKEGVDGFGLSAEQCLLRDMISRSDDIMNWGRVVAGSAFSGKRSR